MQVALFEVAARAGYRNRAILCNDSDASHCFDRKIEQRKVTFLAACRQRPSEAPSSAAPLCGHGVIVPRYKTKSALTVSVVTLSAGHIRFLDTAA